MEPNFQRARQPAQKELRRAHLLATARRALLGGVALRELSLSELARQAGMAKANVYTYFASREALLLSLLWDEWARWFEAFQTQGGQGKDGAPLAELEEVAAHLARSLAGEALLCELTAALPTVLEQNLSEEAIGAFKRESLGFFGELAGFLETCSPALPASAYAELVHDTAHAIMGLYPATHPSPAAARAMADPELAFFRRDFSVELTRFVVALAADHVRRRGAVPGVEESSQRRAL